MSDDGDLRQRARAADAEAAELRALAARLDADREQAAPLLEPLHQQHRPEHWAGIAATASRDRLAARERDLRHLGDLLAEIAADLRTRAAGRDDDAALWWDRWRDAQVVDAEAGGWG